MRDRERRMAEDGRFCEEELLDLPRRARWRSSRASTGTTPCDGVDGQSKRATNAPPEDSSVVGKSRQSTTRSRRRRGSLVHEGIEIYRCSIPEIALMVKSRRREASRWSRPTSRDGEAGASDFESRAARTSSRPACKLEARPQLERPKPPARARRSAAGRTLDVDSAFASEQPSRDPTDDDQRHVRPHPNASAIAASS